ncbi:hypothetical protein T265_09085 [Opisthorchis viverrini]|uniref:Uncharacterized protein n=1 Tax=Opisthorchis viverrini TaxID=6198 RepID=A0A074ZBE9_OPIVI|nr:hypothetical protein T265_09085 [Opisthorchis viverrini]KER22912.1 hypothetical protein T265_09085 [Opisthorchis viverrini]
MHLCATDRFVWSKNRRVDWRYELFVHSVPRRLQEARVGKRSNKKTALKFGSKDVVPLKMEDELLNTWKNSHSNVITSIAHGPEIMEEE